MKIEGNNPVESQELYGKVQESGKNPETDNKEGAQKSDNSKDKISLSGRAKEINELKVIIEELPDIRTDRVDEVKRTIDAGNYNVDSLKVAEKVLEEI
jgi:negative regulator of flagellin synthesis FlgM